MSLPFSDLELALLGLVRQRPQSGYDLRKTFATSAMRHYSDSPGSIYPALRRLQNRNLIAVDESASSPAERRGRTVFAITPAGNELLVAILRQPVTRDDVIWHALALMLRFAFMDGNVPRAVAREFLSRFEAELALYVAELRQNLDAMLAFAPVNTGLLAFQCGIEGMEAQLGWARRALAVLTENPR